MTGLAAAETGTGVTDAVVVLEPTKVTALFGLLLEAVFGDVAFLVTAETFNYILLALVVRLAVLKIAGGAFALGGLFLLFGFGLGVWLIVARETAVHDALKVLLLFFDLFVFLYLDVFYLWVYSALDVHFAHVLYPLLAFDFVWK